MTTLERCSREGRNHQQRRKTPSFSSSLLDAIYHSIDESSSQGKEEHRKRNNNTLEVEEEIANIRRAIMVEKWMENYPSSTTTTTTTTTTTSCRGGSRRVNSDSSSSTDSSFFSSSETEKSTTPKSSIFNPQKPVQKHVSDNSKHEGNSFMRTKSRALKIYGDLKKVKQPISPGGKIANFLNSIFNSRNLKKLHHHHHNHHHQGIVEDWGNSVRKSRSVKDSTTSCSSLTSRSCLNRPQNPSSSRTNKSNRSVRFCPVGVIVDEDSQPCGHKSIYDDHNDPTLTPMPKISSHYIKKNIDSFRYEEKYPKKQNYRGYYRRYSQDKDGDDDDDDSCTSSDLFELENIGIVGSGTNREELPVYGTTNLKINQAIAKGLLV
ncbi:hypothetical protein M9H77_14668 [Catharanthus roseus]|uniref:Uncharacterized protein n=1 Tax=Catharanthus roseus TaxID=4058 RepID=A0ACC0BNZ0_CATRO|nr:hypothetical protein M9H77_14668 [Catharanthus roseus]